VRELLSSCLYLRGRTEYQEAKAALERALKIAEKAFGPESAREGRAVAGGALKIAEKRFRSATNPHVAGTLSLQRQAVKTRVQRGCSHLKRRFGV